MQSDKFGRREALQKLGCGIAVSSIALGSSAARAETSASLVEPGAKSLRELMAKLEKAPRRRDFKTVPMILTDRDQWDYEALDAIMAYAPVPKQVWDSSQIEGPWLNVMRNSLNVQVWSFKHPDFLAVSATHGSANLALYDQAAWDKYQLSKLAGEKFPSNTLIVEKKAASADAKDYEDPTGVFSPADNSIPALMKRGLVFMSCHNAIWEQAAKLVEKGFNPDKLTHDKLAADLTNHLLPGVVIIPGATGTIPELQQVGFHYIS